MRENGLSAGIFDVAIIGAGVVGCAAARRFALSGARVLVLEAGADILSGASKANSAILHSGFDAPAGSLELELIKRGRAEYLEIQQSLGLSMVKTGALVCAWSDEDASKLAAIAAQGRGNGITRLALVDGAQARAIEPGLSPALVGALHVEDEDVIDPWSAPLAYLQQAVALGAQVQRRCELLSGRFDGSWTLETTGGPYRARQVVNAAGLWGDRVDERLGFAAEFQIKPRKGQFIVLDKAAARHLKTIILPVPNEITKGIVICPTAFGNILVGPTAEEQEDRSRAQVDHSVLEMLLAHGQRLVPNLAGIPVTAVYAGLRPASDKKEYRIVHRAEQNCLTLGGIRSTGLSAALGLAQHAADLMGCGTGLVQPPQTSVPNLTETCPRDWQLPDHGEIVCHCEMVTRREIEATFDSPLPPQDYGGLRRRTRAGMGRCQGFYCQARLAQMTEGRFQTPLAATAKVTS